MSTSRATWPRALRLSRAAVLLAVLIFAAAPAVLLQPAFLEAQEQQDQQEEELSSQDVALLTAGPAAARGLPFLPPNVIAHFKGHYEYLGSQITLYYTESEIVRFSEWEAVDCTGYRLYRLSGGAGSAESAESAGAAESAVARPVFFYQADEYALFIQVRPQYLCTFFPRFMSKFVYFRSVRDIPANRPPFPAVVD